MPIRTLPKDHALSSGSELWIAPNNSNPIDNNPWISVFDWYTNGLISRTKFRKPAPLSPEILQIMKEEDLNPIKINTSNDLLIATNKFLPNKMLLLIDNQSSLEAWLTRSSDLAKKTGSTKIRLFLPSQIHTPDVEKFFSSSPELDVTVVDVNL